MLNFSIPINIVSYKLKKYIILWILYKKTYINNFKNKKFIYFSIFYNEKLLNLINKKIKFQNKG